MPPAPLAAEGGNPTPGTDPLPDPTLSTFPALNTSPAPLLAVPGPALPAPTLPPHLQRPLSKRHTALAHYLAAGLSWQQALDRAAIPPRARLRSSAIPRPIAEAADYLIREVAYSCGVNRKWIVENCVALYRRSCQAEQVLDRKGNPTGEWRYDGTTAARMLQMLGEDIGMFGKGKAPGIGADQVAALLEAVAARGKRALAEPRVVGSSDASAAIAPEASTPPEPPRATP